MTPTAAVWSSRISLKRQGFSSTHCTKLPLTPTRMTTIPADTDSRLDLSDIKGNQILSTDFWEGGQCREHPVQGRISQSAWERRLIGTVSCSAFWNSVEQEQCDLRDNRAIQRRDTGGESHRSRFLEAGAHEIGSSKIGQRVVSQAAWIALPKLRYLDDTQSE